MIINIKYDQSPASLPNGFTAGIDAAVSYIEEHFSDPVTININVGYGEVAGTRLDHEASSRYALLSYDYSQIKSALIQHATTSTDQSALAYLPASDPISASHTWFMSSAEARALGLPLEESIPVDGSIGLEATSGMWDFDPSNGIDPGKIDFISDVIHEITEVMGREARASVPVVAGTGGGYTPLDLYRYSAPGTRQLTTGGPSYFSLDNGVTGLDPFHNYSVKNDGEDLGDWQIVDTYGFSSPGVVQLPTQTDLEVMDIIGWNLTSPRPQISINSIAQTNQITSVQATSGANITGTTYGIEDGQTVTVTIVNTSGQTLASLTGTVSNGYWSAHLTGAQAAGLVGIAATVKADVSSAGGVAAPEARRALNQNYQTELSSVKTVVDTALNHAGGGLSSAMGGGNAPGGDGDVATAVSMGGGNASVGFGAAINAGDLPLVGDALKASYEASSTLHAIEQLRQAIDAGISDAQSALLADPDGDAQGIIQAAINQALTAAAANGVSFPEGVSVSTANGLQLTFTDSASVSDSVPLANNLGLPGLNLNLNGSLSATLGYNFNFTAGADASDPSNPYILANNAPLVTVNASASAPDLSSDVSLGFLNFHATDAGSGLNANYAIGLNDPNGDGRIFLSEIDPSIVTQQVSASAAAKLHLESDLGNAALPSIQADLNATWNSGSDPTLSIDNVRYDFGSFVENFIVPILHELDPILQPLHDAIAVLETDITPLDGLPNAKAFLDANDDGKITLLDLVQDATHQDLSSLQAFIGDINQIIDWAAFLEHESFGSDSYHLGSFSVPFNEINNAFDAIPQITEEAEGLGTFLNGLAGDGYSATDPTNNETGEQILNDIFSNTQFSFPILSDPSQAFKVLLGGNADLFDLTLPQLSLNLLGNGFDAQGNPHLPLAHLASLPVPVIPGLSIGVEAAVSAAMNLAFGYDTRGLVRYAQSVQLGAPDPSKIFDGFFVTDKINGVVQPLLKISGFLGLALELNAIIADAAVGGALKGSIDFTLNGSDKLYADQIADALATNPYQIFATSGEIGAQLYAYANVVGVPVWQYFSPSVTLADFSPAFTGSGTPLGGGGTAGAPLELSTATIPYSASAGDVLTITGGMASDPAATVTYQWQDLRAGGTFVDVSGATGPTYTVQDSDIGSLIRVVVTATDTDGTAISTISNIDAPNLATQNGSELDVNLPNGGQNYTIKSDASGGISVYARGFVQPFTGIASVVVTGGHGSDTINSYAGGVAVTITGGSGGDLFAFDATALDDAQTSPPVHQELTDYNANEGDSVDVSPLVSVPYAGGSGSPPDALVRVIADSVGDFANLQVNLAGAGSNWITIARLDGLNIGDNINVILDQSSPAVSIGVLPTLGTLNGTELDLRIPNGDRTYTIGNEGAGVVVAAFGQSQHFDGVHSIVVTGSNGVDTVTLAQGLTIPATVKMPPSSTGTGIFTAALGDTFTGGNGADKFIFNQAALDGVPALRLEQITNYGHGQGDQIDLSALLSNAYNNGNGFPVSRLVRSVEDLSGTFAKVQINPTGVHDKTAWKTIATLGGLHDRDLINVVLDPSQPAGVDISVIPQPTISINTVAGDDRINALEATAGLAISGKTHAVEDGQIVTVTVVDSNNTTVETLTTPVANDTWAANLTTAQANMLVGDPYTIKADVSDVEEIDAPEASHDINPFTPTLYFTSQNFYLGVLLSNDWTSTVLVQPPGLPAFIASTNWSGPAGGGGGAIPTPDDYVELTPTTTDTVFIGASTYQNTNIPLEVKGLLVPDGITLTENAGPLTVDSLLLNSGSINVNASALVVSGELATKGLITVNNGALAARGTLVLDWTGSVKLGGGRITGSDPNAVATLENFVAIGGAGTIGSDGGAPLVLHNHGIIAGAGSGQLLTIATPFADATSAATNDGILEAVDQGGLLIRQTTLIQPNGVIEAIGAGANVLVASSTIEGGILATFGVLPGSDHGTIRSIDANATLDGLSAGAVTIAPGANLLVTDHDTGNEQWNLKGVIHNFGTFLVQPDQYFAHVNAITIDAAGVTLDSGGMIALNQLNGSALLQGATLYNVDNKIGGFGTITATVVNEKNGYIETIPDYQGTLTYSAAQFTNGGTVWTYGGSNIKFVGTTIYGNYQGAIGELVADKANIDLFTTTLEGGTLESANGHAISVDDAAVTFDSTTPAGEVTVAPDATVLVTDVNTGNETLTLKGLIHNFGTVLVQPTQYFAHTNAITVDAVTGVTLDSGGMIALNAVNGSAVLQGGVLENVDNTIGGFGAISATIVNEAAGRIQTRQVTPGILSITAGQLTNYGLIWTQGASAVELHGTTVIQGKQQNPLGHINATNANIDLFGATIEGGTLTTFGNNTISVDDSGVIFDSTTDAGSVTLASGSTVLVTDHHSTNENLVLKGLIHNFGTFLVQPDQYFAHTNAITIDAASVTLDSGGTIALNAVNGSAVLQGGQLTNVDNLIHGTGLIGNGLTLINQAAGVVDADSTGQLTINTDTNVVTNRGLIESTSAAGLLITNSTIDNKGALIKADGATANLYLQSSTIKGGTITETNGGAIRAIDSAVILDGSSSAGAITVSTGTTLTVTDHNSTNEQWILKGTIHNFGTFLVQPDQYFAHVNAVTIDAGGVTLDSGGTVTLNSVNGSAVLQGGQLTNVDNLIHGTGLIGNGLTLINQAAGVVDADSTGQLTINTGTNVVTNRGLVESTSAAGLLITNSTIDNKGALIKADGGNLYLRSATLEGGTITATNGGTIRAIDSAVILDGSSSAGAITVSTGTTLTITDHDSTDERWNLKGTIHNFGTFLVQPDQFFAHINAITIDAGGVTLDSGGTVTLNSVNGSAVLQGGALTNVDNLIHGTGLIGNGLTLINQAAGVIDADSATGLLTINTGTNVVTNRGLIESTNAAGLLITNSTIDNTGALIKADGGNLYLRSATLEGGTITATNGGTIRAIDSAVILDGSSSAGAITVSTGTTLTITDHDTTNEQWNLKGVIHNFGKFLVQPDQYFAHINAVTIDAAGVTLDSGGTIALNSLNGSAVLQGGPLTNVDNTISGDGLLANGFSLINQAAGVVDATFGTFTVGTGAAVVSNQGLIEATDTGALLVTGSTINNADGVIKSDGSNAVIYLRSATIEGGTITATNGGTIRALDSGVTLDGSTAGAITVGAGTTLMVTDHDTTNEQWNLKGTIHNFGKFLVQPDQYFAHVNAITIDAAGVTLDSGGTIALNALNGSAALQGGPLTNVDNTISGDGLLANGFSLINQAAGVVDATFGTFTIATGAAVISNAGLIEATDTGALLVTGSTINNADGVIKSDGSNAAIYLRSATIEGGAIAATNGGTIRALDSGVTLDGSTAGAITVSTGTTLMVTDHDTTNEQWNLKGVIHNFGKLLVQPDQYFAHVNAITIDAAGVTLDSGGTIALNALNGSAVLQGGQLTNVDNLIGGAGYIGNGLTLTNEAAGVIDANSANRTLTVDTAGDLVNDGTLEADGGTLFVADNVTGGGHATVAGGGTIHFAGDFQEDVTFQGGGTPDGGLVGFSSTLAGSLNVMAVGGIAGTIQFSTAYSGTISGFAEGDVIDLSYLNYGGGGQAVLGDGNILHITAGGGTADLQLDPNESFAGKDFQLAPDTGTGTEIIIFRPSDTTPPVLSSVADQTDEATGPSGAVATFAATATDDFDGTDEVVFREGNTVVHSGDTFSLGTHTITASAADSAGNTASENFTITVQDTAAPTLTPVADQTIEAASPTGAAATFSATATDPVDGTDAVVFKEGTAVVHSGDTFSIGTHIVTASATDAAGNTASETFTITVQDTTAPTLTPVANQTQEATSAAGAAAAFSASASDIVDGTDAVVFKEGAAVVHSGDTFSIGSHIVTASATDAAGNTAPETFTITVQDTTAPTLTPVADQTDEATSSTGASVTFSASATDIVDGTDTVVFKEGNAIVHSGDTFALGTHTITASATDTHGNSASETFTITVQDTTAPTLTPVANQTDEATSGTGAAATFSASATDIVDGTDTVVFKEGNAIVHSGDTFGIGTHTITANATDAHGNSASETFTITVQDTTAPTLTPVADQTDEATSSTGASVTFSASATDIVDGTDTVVFKEGNAIVHSGDTFALGTHTITASATDTHGNSASETFTITVQDTTAPTLTPVANQTDEATSGTGAAATFSASATDIVDGTDTVVFKEGNAIVHSGDTFGIGTHTITANATDAHGNSASETFTITVQDTTAPTLTPIANQTKEATSAAGTAATFSASATDLVDGTDPVTFKEGNTVVHSSDTFSIGTHTLTASATDTHGNSASETFTITVQDTTAPTLTPVANQIQEATSIAGAAATFSASASDIVDGTDAVAFKEGNVVVHSGDAFSIGAHTITASATDTHGNSASETFTITVQDTTAPTLTPLADQTIEATSIVGAAATFSATATDLVDGPDAVVFKEGDTVVHSGDAFSIGTHTVTASATDLHGNTRSENFTITVQDTTPPILTPVVSQTKGATSSAGAVATFSATAIDVVDGIDQVVFKEDTAVVHSGDTFSVGTHTITASATDTRGNTSSENFTITVVQDTTAPTLTPLADQTIEAIFPGGAPATFAATATDAVDGTDPVAFTEGNLAVVSGQSFGLGTHVITASATDAAGNTSSENFTIKVVDTTPPILTPVVSQTKEATSGAGAVATFSATAIDVVDGIDQVVFNEGTAVVHSGDTFSLGTHIITASATDAAGNTSSENFTITVVQDITPPTLMPIADQTIEAIFPGGAPAIFAATATDLMDGFDPVAFKEGNLPVVSGQPFGLGTHVITASATDAAGNTSSENFTINVVDTTPPRLTPVGDQTNEATSGAGAAATFSASASDIVDGSDPVTFKEGNTVVHSGDAFSIGTHTITASATDAHGNASSETFTIKVVDTRPPTLAPVGDQTNEAASAAGAVATFSATATDTVDGTDPVVFKEGNAVVHAGDTFSVGPHVILASATDAAGNTSLEIFTINVVDTTPPTLTPIANQTVEAIFPGGAPAPFAASATDIVDGTDPVLFTEGNTGVVSGLAFGLGTHTITASATDAHGNSASETFTITVQDTTAPTLTPVANQTLEATSIAGAAATFSATATDLVDGPDAVVFKEGDTVVHSSDSFSIGTHTVTASATDSHGNTGSENFTITVQDTTPPILTPVVSQTKEATSSTGAVATFSATAIDVVDGIDQVVFKEDTAVVHSGDTFSVGTHTITASATDTHGNSASETFTVTVQDTTAPTLTPVSNQTQEATGIAGAAATFSASASDIVDGSDPVTFKQGSTVVHSGDTFGIGTHTITANATDAHGNAASETFTLTVQDTTAPTLTPVANQTQEATSAAGAAATFSASASDIVDGSDPVTFKQGNTVVHSGDTFSIGTHTITASATDAHGNAASETFTITVQDTAAPTLTPVANQTQEATSAAGAAATFSASASDIVDGTDAVAFKEGNVVVHSGDTFSLGTHTLTASATDTHGNAASETFTITVQDTTAPTLTPVANQTLQQTDPGGAVATFSASASDLVDGSDPITFKEGNTVVHSGDLFSIGSHTINAITTDAHNNSASETFSITVESSSIQFVSGGTVSSGVTVTSGHTLKVLSGGTELAASIQGGGTEDVGSGGTASGDHVASGGTFKVEAGGVASGTIVSGGGVDDVFGSQTQASINGSATIEAGGSADHLTVSNGGVLDVLAGGAANATTVQAGGSALVMSGASTSGSTIAVGGVEQVFGVASVTSVGGSQTTFSGGTEIGTRILNGGNDTIAFSGTSLSATVSSGGIQTVLAGGIASSTTVAGSAYQLVSGGTTTGTVVNGGIELLFSGAVGIGTNVFSGGQENIASGASVSGGSINGSGATLIDAGTASGITLNTGGVAYVQSGASATGTTISGNGAAEVVSGTTLSTLVLSGGLEFIASGGIASSVVVSNGGQENVGLGGIAGGATILSGGQLIEGGIARNVVLSTGAVAYIQSAASLSGVTVFRGGAEVVRPGGSTSATVLSGGGTAISGSAVSTTVGAGSVDFIASGGSASTVVVSSGGQENVGAGGTVSGVTVSSGGSLLDAGRANSVLLMSGTAAYVQAGGTASGLTVLVGAADIVSAGGVASGTVLSGGAEAVFGGVTIGTIVSGTGGVEYVAAPGTASNTVVSSGGQENVAADGTAVGTTILSGAILIDAGNVTSAAVNSGAAAYIFSGGSMTGTTVAGADIISSGGVASGTVLNRGAEVVSGGGVAVGAIVSSGGVEYVASGGVVSSAVVTSGGQENVAAGGLARGTIVSASGLLLDAGTMSGTVLSSGGAAYVQAGGVAVGTVLRGGAADVVLAGGVASGTTFSSGGTEAVFSGGVTMSALVTSGGLEYVVGGGVASAAVISGGTLEVTSGGSTGSGAVTFAVSGGGILQLDDSVHYGGLVAGFGKPDFIDFRDIAFNAATTTLSWTQVVSSGANASGTLTLADTVHSANVTLLGQYVVGNFTKQTDLHGGTLVGDPPVVAQTDTQAIGLVNPHHA